MSTSRPCASCSAPVQAADVRCPRCCAFQPRFVTSTAAPFRGYREAAPAVVVDAVPAAAPASGDTSLAERAAEAREEPSLASTLFVPAAGSRPVIRALDAALTAIGLPILVVALIPLVLVFARFVHDAGEAPAWQRSREAWARGLSIAAAFLALTTLLARTTDLDPTYFGVLCACLGALVARSALRYVEERALGLDDH